MSETNSTRTSGLSPVPFPVRPYPVPHVSGSGETKPGRVRIRPPRPSRTGTQIREALGDSDDWGALARARSLVDRAMAARLLRLKATVDLYDAMDLYHCVLNGTIDPACAFPELEDGGDAQDRALSMAAGDVAALTAVLERLVPGEDAAARAG